MRRVDGEDLADDEPVEQHADRGQMLLDGRPRGRALPDGAIAGIQYRQRLQIGGDVERLDIGQLANAVLLEPGEERTRRRVIGHAGVVVFDRGDEKTEETAGRPITGIGDHRRDGERTAKCRARRLDHRRQVAPAAHGDTL